MGVRVHAGNRSEMPEVTITAPTFTKTGLIRTIARPFIPTKKLFYLTLIFFV